MNAMNPAVGLNGSVSYEQGRGFVEEPLCDGGII